MASGQLRGSFFSTGMRLLYFNTRARLAPPRSSVPTKPGKWVIPTPRMSAIGTPLLLRGQRAPSLTGTLPRDCVGGGFASALPHASARSLTGDLPPRNAPLLPCLYTLLL